MNTEVSNGKAHSESHCISIAFQSETTEQDNTQLRFDQPDQQISELTQRLRIMNDRLADEEARTATLSELMGEQLSLMDEFEDERLTLKATVQQLKQRLNELGDGNSDGNTDVAPAVNFTVNTTTVDLAVSSEPTDCNECNGVGVSLPGSLVSSSVSFDRSGGTATESLSLTLTDIVTCAANAETGVTGVAIAASGTGSTVLRSTSSIDDSSVNHVKHNNAVEEEEEEEEEEVMEEKEKRVKNSGGGGQESDGERNGRGGDLDSSVVNSDCEMGAVLGVDYDMELLERDQRTVRRSEQLYYALKTATAKSARYR